MRLCSHSAASSLAILLLVLLATGSLRAELEFPEGLYGYDGRLPVYRSQPLNFEVPGPADDFIAAHGDGFRIYWDHDLDTPRLLVPTQPFQLYEEGQLGGLTPSTAEDALTAVLLEFVDLHSEFFGMGREELAEPEIRDIDHLVVAHFRQKAGDLFVRGANLRFVLDRQTGRLVILKAFVMRDPPVHEAPFAPVEPVIEFLQDGRGLEILDIERQLAFGSFNPADSRPIWRIRFERPEGPMGEAQVDAWTGTRIEMREYRFDLRLLNGTLVGSAPTLDPEDPNYLFTRPGENQRFQPFPFARVEGEFSSTTADSLGGFEIVEPGTLEIIEEQFGDEVIEREVLIGKARSPVVSGHCIDTLAVEAMTALGAVRTIETCVIGESTFIPRVRWVRRCHSDDTVTYFPLFKKFDLDGRGHEIPLGSEAVVSGLSLLAFHHAAQFHHEVDRFIPIDSGKHSALLPLSLRALSRVGSLPTSLHYFPGSTQGVMCLPRQFQYRVPFRPRTELQDLTPTVINHEVAHHMIFQMTGALHGYRFDCGTLGQGDFEARPPEEVDCIEVALGADVFRQVSAIEGFADALAAIHEGESRFAFTDQGIVAGPLAYDIQHRGNENIEPNRELVAHQFWELFRRVTPEKDDDLKNGLEFLIYSFLATNFSKNGDSQIFSFPPEIMEEFLLLSQQLQGELKNTFSLSPTEVRRFLSAIDNRTDIFEEFKFTQFIRGDVDGDGQFNITDPIFLLSFLFLGTAEVSCRDSADVDDSGRIDVTDPLFALQSLFLGGGPPIPPPSNGCGFDPTLDEFFICSDRSQCEV